MLGAPKGKIGGDLHIAAGRGGNWSAVNRHDKFHIKYGLLYGVAPQMPKAMEVIESGGDEQAQNHNGYPNRGIMQLTYSLPGKPKTKWELVADKLRVDFNSPEGQIAVACYVLGGHDGDKGTPEQIFLSHYYPIKGGLDVKGPDGHTQRQYLNDMQELIRQIDAAAARGEGTLAPEPVKDGPPVVPVVVPSPQDIVEVITGGRHTDDSYGYKTPQAANTSGFYDYFVGHGGEAHQHTGIDASLPRGATLYAPFDGTIVCTHTGGEAGAWSSGCAAFSDARGGAGRVELLHTDGKRSIILGHCQACLVPLGAKVRAGQPIAKSGEYHGGHVHIEAREYVGGTTLYMIRNPRTLFLSGPAREVPSLGEYTFVGTDNYEDRAGVKPCALVYHMTDDLSYSNVRDWFQNPASKASAHWVIDRDGAKYQFVGSAMAAWTNGDVQRARRDIPWIARHADDWEQGRDRANRYTITFEFVAKPGTAAPRFTEQQIASGIVLARYYLGTYPTIPNNRAGHTRHSDYNSVTRSGCPGDEFPMTEIIVACGGDPKDLGQ